MALDPVKRRELFEALARRFPIQELLDEIVLEADVVPDADDHDGQTTDQEPDEERQPGENDAKPAQRTAVTKKPHRREEAGHGREEAGCGRDEATATKTAAGGKKQTAGTKKQTAGATKPAATEHRRRHVSRQRGDANGQSRRKPPNRGTRA